MKPGTTDPLATLARTFLRLVSMLLLAFAATPSWAQSVERVALVIVNSQYRLVPALRNPAADGRLMAQSLRQAGFTSVEIFENLDKSAMEKVLRDFGNKADRATVAFIYYAGHGIEFGGRNYLIPVDAALVRDRDIETEAVPLDSVVSVSEGAKRLRIIVLDACRNNPFSAKMARGVASRGVGRGLAPVEPLGESLIVYSAKAGATAADGEGANSPFAKSLAARIIEPGREISLLFRQVRDDVLRDTDGDQEPFTYGSLSGTEFYFVGGRTSVPTQPIRPVRAAPLDLEEETWGLCRSAVSQGPCSAYVQRYAKGRFIALANDRLRDIAGAATGSRSSTIAAAGPSELVPALGLTVQRRADIPGALRVVAIQSNSLAEGQLFVDDLITQIDSAPIDGASSPRQAIEQRFNDDHRVKFLIRRGPTTTIVVLREAPQ